MVCSANYTDIAFSCTNTTYVDSNGDADGVTVFVATDCGSNDRLPFNQQDVKYSSLNNNVPILVSGIDEFLTNSVSSALSGIDAMNILPGEGPAAPDPIDVDTCNRGCICGYSPNQTQTLSFFSPMVPAYILCECDMWLQNYLSDKAANISLLDHYSVNYTSLMTTNSSTDAEPLQSPFECFGDPLTIGTAVFQYVDDVGYYIAGR